MEVKVKNYKITLEYDGRNYFGWQRQQNKKSIQEEIEKALSNLLNQEIKITGAGRTDKGVHAFGQVANFKASTRRSLNEIKNGINALLPSDIFCKKTENVNEKFSARFSAKKRYYIYKISLNYSVFEKDNYYYLRKNISISKMNKAAQIILNTNNFRSICKNMIDEDNYNCNIFSSEWKKIGNNKFTYNIKANRFLYGMVRSLVGLMIKVGQKKITINEFKAILKSNNKIVFLAPANGLYLNKIYY